MSDENNRLSENYIFDLNARTHGNPACSLTHLDVDSLDISLEEELEVAEDDEVAAVAAALAAAAAAIRAVVVQCRKEEEQEVGSECQIGSKSR